MDILITIFLYAVPILLAVSLHEAAHGWIAHLLGDNTAKSLGRLTANPLKHIDPVGTIAVPIVMFFLTYTLMGVGVPFGWARPVPVDVRNFASPQKDMALVAVAGPAANFLMAVFWTLVLAASTRLASMAELAASLKLMADVGIIINLVLMVLNLIPIPPLDGGRIVMGVMPFRFASVLARYEMVGFILLIFLLFQFNLFENLIKPMVGMFQMLIFTLLGI